MANEKPPRGDAAKRPTPSTRSNKARPGIPTRAEPVSSAEAMISTSRNATIQGNASIDLDEVRRRAYELYEQRGRVEGHHEQDWHMAEREVRGRRQSARSQNGIREEKRRA